VFEQVTPSAWIPTADTITHDLQTVENEEQRDNSDIYRSTSYFKTNGESRYIYAKYSWIATTGTNPLQVKSSWPGLPAAIDKVPK